MKKIEHTPVQDACIKCLAEMEKFLAIDGSDNSRRQVEFWHRASMNHVAEDHEGWLAIWR